MRRGIFGALAVALQVAAAGCGGHPIEPSGPDLGGRWRGQADIGMGLATPLDTTLQDQGGRLTGAGGGADCRYFRRRQRHPVRHMVDDARLVTRARPRPKARAAGQRATAGRPPRGSP